MTQLLFELVLFIACSLLMLYHLWCFPDEVNFFCKSYIYFFLYLFNCLGCFTLQPASPIRSEVDVKLGGTQCNVVMTRLHPWMRVLALRKKKMVLRGESTTSERSHSSDHKAFMWTSTISAPEMTVVLYDLNGSPLYHVRPFAIISTSFTLIKCIGYGSYYFSFLFQKLSVSLCTEENNAVLWVWFKFSASYLCLILVSFSLRAMLGVWVVHYAKCLGWICFFTLLLSKACLMDA